MTHWLLYFVFWFAEYYFLSFSKELFHTLSIMVLSSPFQPLNIPYVNLLTYLYPKDEPISDESIWHDSEDPSICLSKRQQIQWIKRLGVGLDKLDVKYGEVVLIFTPNHIFVPVAYLGVVASKRIFSGVNPIYTVPGKLDVLYECKG